MPRLIAVLVAVLIGTLVHVAPAAADPPLPEVLSVDRSDDLPVVHIDWHATTSARWILQGAGSSVTSTSPPPSTVIDYSSLSPDSPESYRPILCTSACDWQSGQPPFSASAGVSGPFVIGEWWRPDVAAALALAPPSVDAELVDDGVVVIRVDAGAHVDAPLLALFRDGELLQMMEPSHLEAEDWPFTDSRTSATYSALACYTDCAPVYIADGWAQQTGLGEADTVQHDDPLASWSPPRNVTAAQVANEAAAVVSWEQPETMRTISYYRVRTIETGMSTYAGPEETETAIDGLAFGETYTFEVSAVGYSTESAPSVASNPITPLTVPNEPTDVRAVPGDTSVTLSWEPPAFVGGTPITHYFVRDLDSGEVMRVDEPATSLVVTGLTNGTAYRFEVWAVNARGASNSALTSWVTPGTPPSAPRDVMASPGDRQATVWWSEPADLGGLPVTGYTVTVVETSSTYVAEADAASLVVAGLDNGSSYTFTVTATNDRGTSHASLASAAVVPRGEPGAPQDVNASPRNGAARVSWQPPGSDGGSAVEQYRISVVETGDSYLVTGDERSVVVDGLTNGESYRFTVAAITAGGETASEPTQPVVPCVLTSPALPAPACSLLQPSGATGPQV